MKGGTRPEAGPRRQIAVVVDFETVADLHESENLPYGRMGDLVDGARVLELRIDDPVPVLKNGGRYRHEMWQYLSMVVDRTAPPLSRYQAG